jgi:hypothetical protein
MIADGSIRASDAFPVDRFLFELNSSRVAAPFEGMRFVNMVLDGAGLGNGILAVGCAHFLYDGLWVFGFNSYGLHMFNGFEYYVTNSWISGGDTSDETTCVKHNATGVAIEASDSSITDSVVFCTKLGIYLNAGTDWCWFLLWLIPADTYPC